MALKSSLISAQPASIEDPITYFSPSLCYINNIAAGRFGKSETKRWAIYDASRSNRNVLKTDHAAYVSPEDFDMFYEMSTRAAPGSLHTIIRQAREKRYPDIGGRILVLDELKDEFLDSEHSPIIIKLDYPKTEDNTPTVNDTPIF